jgi:hypothetical protein
MHVEEEVRFELTDQLRPPVFKTGAISQALPSFLMWEQSESNTPSTKYNRSTICPATNYGIYSHLWSQQESNLYNWFFRPAP